MKMEDIEDMLAACDELDFYGKYTLKRSNLLAESALQVYLAAREIRKKNTDREQDC